ncbi:flagellar brake protein [Paenibacillus sp. GCM10023252]|uniref:flagellar brake protein n=1 Tax=Paenibacillus sp. GCM10023252 TaxID=3252649 RepID=UPI00360C33F1
MLPRVNQALFYQIASSDEEEAKAVYKSRIADELEDGLLIEFPLQEKSGRMKRLYLGDELSAYFMSEDGVKHFFNSHVLGFKDEVIKLVKIHKPSPDQITKIQRRQFLRVSAELEIAVKMSDHLRFIATTDDVGGGGISLICDGKWPVTPEAALDCWLVVPYKNGAIEHVSFKAEIIRVAELATGRKQVMIKFLKITDGERQKIIRYCFERQLEFRNR